MIILYLSTDIINKSINLSRYFCFINYILIVIYFFFFILKGSKKYAKFPVCSNY